MPARFTLTVCVLALCSLLVSASWPSFTKICSKKCRPHTPEWNECVISGVEGEVSERKRQGTFDEDFDTMDVPQGNNFPCDTPLPTPLSREMFAHESVKGKPFCGRTVFMDKTDNLLKEGPQNCPYSQTSCKNNGELRGMVAARENVKGSIYYNCFTKICLPNFSGRRLRRRYL